MEDKNNMADMAYMERLERTRWFMQSRFGLFIHWGLYAIPGRGEWAQSRENIPVEDYARYLGEFNLSRYDPSKWAKSAYVEYLHNFDIIWWLTL